MAKRDERAVSAGNIFLARDRPGARAGGNTGAAVAGAEPSFDAANLERSLRHGGGGCLGGTEYKRNAARLDVLRDRYFEKDGQAMRIKRDIHSRVNWGIANLMDEEQIAPRAAADFIFCRNVFIYFSENAIRRAVHSFAKFIRAPGYLFVGAAESLIRLTTDFNLIEIDDAFVYMKRERVI